MLDHYKFNTFFIYSGQPQIPNCERSAEDLHQEKYLKGSIVIQKFCVKKQQNYPSIKGA